MTSTPGFLLGTINGRVASVAIWRGQRVAFDGTTLGLTLALVEAGALVGDEARASFGSTRIGPDARCMVLKATGGGSRTPAGVWADRPRCTCGAVVDDQNVCLYPGNHTCSGDLPAAPVAR